MGCGGGKPKEQPGLKTSVAQRQEMKIVLLGNALVGKTSIVECFYRGLSDQVYQATLGGTFYEIPMKTSDGQDVSLHIWDTAGTERYRALMPIYYRDAEAAIIVYDLTNPDTLEGCQYWIDELDKHLGKCCLALVGNKADLPDQKVTEAQLAPFLAAGGNIFSCVTSAKTGKGVKELFQELVERLFRQRNKP